ncbi:MAG: response regulator [Nitrospirae bacterium]|nr:response regulator [Candidatus Manganitrophaceae bacterium]
MAKKILIIDDEQLLLDLLTHLLSKIGYEVDQALDSQEAAGKLKDQTYDAIFLDMKMPLMDGKAFYSTIKQQFPELAKRIVFVTGDVANPDTVSFLKGAGNLHLQKPFTIQEVKSLLDRFFKSGEAASAVSDTPR